jgi:hypothetical protein
MSPRTRPAGGRVPLREPAVARLPPSSRTMAAASLSTGGGAAARATSGCRLRQAARRPASPALPAPALPDPDPAPDADTAADPDPGPGAATLRPVRRAPQRWARCRSQLPLMSPAISFGPSHSGHLIRAISFRPSRSGLIRGELVVDLPDLLDDPDTHRMLQVEDLVQGPVHVVGEVRGLFPQPVGRVPQDSPGASPATSTANSCPHAGQVTSASVCPSWLIRR